MHLVRVSRVALISWEIQFKLTAIDKTHPPKKKHCKTHSLGYNKNDIQSYVSICTNCRTRVKNRLLCLTSALKKYLGLVSKCQSLHASLFVNQSWYSKTSNVHILRKTPTSRPLAAQPQWTYVITRVSICNISV